VKPRREIYGLERMKLSKRHGHLHRHRHQHRHRQPRTKKVLSLKAQVKRREEHKHLKPLRRPLKRSKLKRIRRRRVLRKVSKSL
jgi:hypothetical protein